MINIKTSHLIYGTLTPSMGTGRVGEEEIRGARHGGLIMSRLSSAQVKTVTTEEQVTFLRRKPVLVHVKQENPGDCVTRRVQEVVELELANGSMPA